MDEDRVVELETRVAFQEQTIHALSEELVRQGRQVERLERELTVLAQRVENVAEEVGGTGSEPPEPPPPHY